MGAEIRSVAWTHVLWAESTTKRSPEYQVYSFLSPRNNAYWFSLAFLVTVLSCWTFQAQVRQKQKYDIFVSFLGGMCGKVCLVSFQVLLKISSGTSRQFSCTYKCTKAVGTVDFRSQLHLKSNFCTCIIMTKMSLMTLVSVAHCIYYSHLHK